MIVVFLVVLVVFGPQKLPELARSLGKLMAEFRKASTDFKNAFEEEMRDLERQARVAELRKKTAEAEAAEAKAKAAVLGTPDPLASPPNPEALPELPADYPMTSEPVLQPAADAVPRLDAAAGENGAGKTEDATESSNTSEAAKAHTAAQNEGSQTETPPPHDHQQPA